MMAMLTGDEISITVHSLDEIDIDIIAEKLNEVIID